MRRIERECNRTISSALTAARAALGAVTVMTAVAACHAQDFADLKRALVDYSKAESEPRKPCEALARFKSKGDCAYFGNDGASWGGGRALPRHRSDLPRDRI